MTKQSQNERPDFIVGTLDKKRNNGKAQRLHRQTETGHVDPKLESC